MSEPKGFSTPVESDSSINVLATMGRSALSMDSFVRFLAVPVAF